MNVSVNTYLVLELFNLYGAITYLNVGKFGSTGIKYPVLMLISVNRGVVTFHGITFCGMKITGLFPFADLETT